jgi:non-canonical poly(A) RNA polymerase PAPD5/7
MVVPGEHDTAVRCRLIQRVSTAIGRKLSQFDWPEASTQCFGSFPTGLYLPVADMDLVYISDYHYQGGHPQITTSNAKLWKIGHILESKGIAADLTVIGKAKVPIIKFVDRLTGLPVDISFEQRGGIDAQYYFSKWQNDFPDLRYLVALVKQLLLMHKLNEVNSGGLGGFSIICLVAFFLHETVKDESLGTMFLQFLDYYGKFDLSRHRIVMVPPSLQPKVKMRRIIFHTSADISQGHIGIDGRPEKVGRLSIQDPTNPENNISGGSSEIQRIFTLFRTTHDTLRDRMNAIRNDLPYNSILEPVLGGNYTPYADYRERMDKLK